MTPSAEISPLAINRVSESISVSLVTFEASGGLSGVQRCLSMSSLRVARLAATTSVQVDLGTTGSDVVAIVVNYSMSPCVFKAGSHNTGRQSLANFLIVPSHHSSAWGFVSLGLLNVGREWGFEGSTF
jgi:hypothetical protein